MTEQETPQEPKYKPEDYTGSSTFVHLHNHTIYSTLDGVSLPSQYAEQCAKRGYPAMAATEHGHMGSFPDMYSEFKKAGLKAIAGCEIYFNDYEPERQRLTRDISIRSLRKTDAKDPNYKDNLAYAERLSRNRHLTVLAKNMTGYHNLLKLTTQAYKTGFYYKPRIWFDKLCEYREGLIVLSGCLNGPVAHELRIGNGKNEDGKPLSRMQSPDGRGAVDWVRKFKAAFGEDYYIELQMPGIENDDVVFRNLVKIADHLKIKKVLANDCHYLKRKDFEIQKVMMAIDQDLPIDSPDLFHVNSDEQFMKTRAELWAMFKNNAYSNGIDDGAFEDMCDNTLLVAEKCEKLKIDDNSKIPNFENADAELRNLAITRLRERGLDKIEQKFLIDGIEVTYEQQLEIELARIVDKGFSSYFLITYDLVRYGVEKGWPFSPRGSASGCLVCYVLGISAINPLVWGLSFDRFLSPSRGGYMLKCTMPAPIKKA